jgi:hypothetical protein
MEHSPPSFERARRARVGDVSTGTVARIRSLERRRARTSARSVATSDGASTVSG